MHVVAFPDKYVLGYPKNPIDPRGVLCELGTLLGAPFDSDAHFVGYATDLRCRLSIDLFTPEHADKIAAANACMTAAIFDVDDPVTHGTDEPARPEWWEAEKAKLSRLREVHPDLFAYRTRGGYRIVFALAQAHALRSHADAAAWRALYLSWRKYLGRRFGIAVDRACADWTRFFRAPNVVRDGVRQEWETAGDPNRIGVWAPELSDEDRVAPKKQGASHYGAVAPVPIADPASVYGRARIARAVEYLRTAPLSIKGEAGRNVMFGICAVLVRRMRLPIEIAAELIDAVYNPRLAAAGTDTWSVSAPSRHGMSIVERLEKARDTGNVPPGNVIDEATWAMYEPGGVW
jgi:hypothetical protein